MPDETPTVELWLAVDYCDWERRSTLFSVQPIWQPIRFPADGLGLGWWAGEGNFTILKGKLVDQLSLQLGLKLGECLRLVPEADHA